MAPPQQMVSLPFTFFEIGRTQRILIVDEMSDGVKKNANNLVGVQVDDFDGLLRNLPTVPAKKRGKRCTMLITGGMTAVEKAELNVQRAQERLQKEQVKATQPKK